MSARSYRAGALGLALSAGLAACSLTGGHSTPRAHPTVTTVAAASTTTTVPGVQTSGPRTVLSPIGLHVRAAPSRAAKVLGTAAQGVVLTVSGHTPAGGGWFKVRGAKVTGWISANPALSAPGRFSGYSSRTHQFVSLYPVAWTVRETPASAVFRGPSGSETIVVSTAPTAARLGRDLTGYSKIRSESIVACGVTGTLDTYMHASPGSGTAAPPYYAQIRLTLDAKHALGIQGNLTSFSELQTVRDFANSITFPFPRCEG